MMTTFSTDDVRRLTMRVPHRKSWIILALLAPAVGYAGYWLGVSVWANHRYRAAQDAAARRDFAEADRQLRDALSVWPGDAAVQLLAAQTARRQGNFGAAHEHLRAYRRAHGSPEAAAREEELARLQKGDLAEADAVLRASTEQPQAPESALMLEAYIEGHLKVLSIAASVGMPISLKKDAGLPRGIDLWLEQRGAPADRAQGLVWHGQVRTLEGAYAEAATDFRAALALDPKQVAARWHLAKNLIEAAPADSAQLLESLRREYPDDRDVRILLATARRNLGDLNQAQQLLDELLTATPDDVAVLLERGQVALDARRPQDAETWLRRAETLAPQLPAVSLALARCLLVAGRADEARRYQDRHAEVQSQQQAARNEILHKLRPLGAGARP
jgi:predicted Zn-dependent protease